MSETGQRMYDLPTIVPTAQKGFLVEAIIGFLAGAAFTLGAASMLGWW